MGSEMSIRRGRVKTTVRSCLRSVVSRSRGAIARDEGSCLRSFWARRESRIGPYVSGRKTIRASVVPAIMKPIQKTQRQPILGPAKPEMIGDRMGPPVVHWIGQYLLCIKKFKEQVLHTHHHKDGERPASRPGIVIYIRQYTSHNGNG